MDDPLQFKSDNVQARCMPEDATPNDSSWDGNHLDIVA